MKLFRSLLLLLIAGVAFAEDDFMLLPPVDVEIVGLAQDGKIKVGDQLTLKFKTPVTAAKIDFQPAPPLKPGEKPGEKTDAKPQDQWAIDDDIITVKETNEQVFKGVPLKPGQIALPGLVLKDTAGKAVGRTTPLQLVVESAIKKDDKKPNEPVDLQPPVSLTFPVWMIFLAGFLVLGLLAAAIYAYSYWKRKKKGALPAVPAKPPLPEDEQALLSFLEIERKAYMKAGHYKLHYFSVSETLKRYLSARYVFDASESTTDEILNHLEKSMLLGATELDKLESLMTRMDVVKFTDTVPTEAEGKAVLEDARKFVFSTRKPPVAAILAEKQNAV